MRWRLNGSEFTRTCIIINVINVNIVVWERSFWRFTFVNTDNFIQQFYLICNKLWDWLALFLSKPSYFLYICSIIVMSLTSMGPHSKYISKFTSWDDDWVKRSLRRRLSSLHLKLVQLTLMLTGDWCKMLNKNVPIICQSCVPDLTSTSLKILMHFLILKSNQLNTYIVSLLDVNTEDNFVLKHQKHLNIGELKA